MCGIFGIIKKNDSIESKQLDSITRLLFKLSESRGKDASGLAVVFDKNIKIIKSPIKASNLIKTEEYKKLFLDKPIFALLGHSRMETNGSFFNNNNNQPIIKNNIVTIHNGIIVNDDNLWKKNKDLKRIYNVDTEIINSLLSKYLKKGNSVQESIKKVYSKIEGAASTAFIFGELNCFLLATNTGSLYILENKDLIIFASEKYFLKKIIKIKFKQSINNCKITHLKPNNAYLIDLQNLNKLKFSLKQTKDNKSRTDYQVKKRKIIVSQPFKMVIPKKIDNKKDTQEINNLIMQHYQHIKKKVDHLKRCTKCVLPETMPFISFNKKGVCNFCQNFQEHKLKKINKLTKILDQYRRKDGKPDCIVAFSGGRDSSYALHYVKNVLKMNPVAYSYDWGMLTDLGRRNQSRMTASLEVEHILISADIQKKLSNIKKNVLAWVKRPSLGTIPLFMAGDKQYFYYANKLMKQMDIKLLFLCECPLEKTDFKTGFCGVPPKTDKKGRFYAISFKNKLKMAFFYLKEFILNPSFLNSSLIDTLSAFKSYYFIPHDYISFYDYVKWDEKEIDKTLKEYNWEFDPEINSSWRIGDGTAAFYNYIYYTMSGLTENDTFRSNQIRSGDIKRADAIKLVNDNNQPRPNSMIWYADTIQIPIKKTISIINKTINLISKN
ncbi:MAG: hypothetical protein PHD49_03680 [Candidatus Shapirobacteria bacterium]|nr:hypothetical protein [Candidatus Shapirobacteria bacterium]MDD4383212.1 hypothetical protein [Candidatus Shapirobacteria bacterium]